MTREKHPSQHSNAPPPLWAPAIPMLEASARWISGCLSLGGVETKWTLKEKCFLNHQLFGGLEKKKKKENTRKDRAEEGVMIMSRK